jgi:hypothetical protein
MSASKDRRPVSLLIPATIALLSVALSYVAAQTVYRPAVVQCQCSTPVKQLLCFDQPNSHPGRKVKLNTVYPFS